MATGAINELTSIPAPKEIELTGNEVKSKVPSGEREPTILKEVQTITLTKDILTTPAFFDALEVTGVNKMLPTEVRLGIS